MTFSKGYKIIPNIGFWKQKLLENYKRKLNWNLFFYTYLEKNIIYLLQIKMSCSFLNQYFMCIIYSEINKKSTKKNMVIVNLSFIVLLWNMFHPKLAKK